MFIERDNTSLYKSAVIRIISDRSKEAKLLQKELFKTFFLFLIVIFIVVILLYITSLSISNPITHFLTKVDDISKGNLDINVKETGFYEINKLAEGFNLMIEKIRSRNTEIEQQSKNLRISNRNLNEAYELLNKQKLIIESKNKDLTSSINYSLRIQQSFMPSVNKFHEIFNDSFVLNLPRDIVSGDFYWFSEIDNKLILAVADCTGHGVPGAFTSMIGMSILHQIINHDKISDPATILTKLNSEIYEMLQKTLNEDNFYVGMDISVCTIDMKTNILQFCGAQRPMIMIKDNDLKSFRGNIFPIGEYYNQIEKKFTNNTIELNNNDTIFLFTDGYTTQFSEYNRSKFTVKRLQNLLLSFKDLPLKDQKAELNRNFIEWRGIEPQVDDILVLGFRYIKQ